MGYLSKTQSEREETLIIAANTGRTTVFYESPNRILKSLATIEEILGHKQQVFVAVELTKRHENHFRGPVKEVREEIE